VTPFDAVALTAVSGVAVPLFQALLDSSGKILGLFGQQLDRATKQLIYTASGEYASRYTQRHGQIKLLGMRQPLDLSAVYVPLLVAIEDEARQFPTLAESELNFAQTGRLPEPRGRVFNAIDLVRQYPYLMLVGSPGTGKTTILRQLGLTVLQGKFGTRAPNVSRFASSPAAIASEVRAPQPQAAPQAAPFSETDPEIDSEIDPATRPEIDPETHSASSSEPRQDTGAAPIAADITPLESEPIAAIPVLVELKNFADRHRPLGGNLRGSSSAIGQNLGGYGGSGDGVADGSLDGQVMRQFERQFDLKAALIEEFEVCGFPEADRFVEIALERGKLMILLDGLDELPQEQHNVAISQIQNFVDRYNKNRFLCTCRSAVHHNLKQFVDAVVLPLAPGQVAQFTRQWSRVRQTGQALNPSDTSERLDHSSIAAQVPANLPTLTATIAADLELSDLSRSPLLLTLLSLTSPPSLARWSNRPTLYHEILTLYLRTWGELKRVRRSPLYPDFGLSLQQQFFSKLALDASQEGRIFWTRRSLVKALESFLQERLQAPDYLDGEALLEAIVAQQGILTERSRDLFAFAHITLHAYCASLALAEQAEDLEDSEFQALATHLVAQHLGDPLWRSILRLWLVQLGDRGQILLKILENTLKSLEKPSYQSQIAIWQRVTAAQEGVYTVDRASAHPEITATNPPSSPDSDPDPSSEADPQTDPQPNPQPDPQINSQTDTDRASQLTEQSDLTLAHFTLTPIVTALTQASATPASVTNTLPTTISETTTPATNTPATNTPATNTPATNTPATNTPPLVADFEHEPAPTIEAIDPDCSPEPTPASSGFKPGFRQSLQEVWNLLQTDLFANRPETAESEANPALDQESWQGLARYLVACETIAHCQQISRDRAAIVNPPTNPPTNKQK